MTGKEVKKLIEETRAWYEKYLEIRGKMISTEAIAILDEQADVIIEQFESFCSEISEQLDKYAVEERVKASTRFSAVNVNTGESYESYYIKAESDSEWTEIQQKTGTKPITKPVIKTEPSFIKNEKEEV